MFIAVSHLPGSRPLAYRLHWTLTETPGHPTVALSHGDPAAMLLQDQCLHALQQVIGGVDVGVGQPKAQDVGTEVAELVSWGSLGPPPPLGKGQSQP